ncbi:hypothetical protein [Methylobacterium trifolii]|uniref:Uncharacterized protein n=1 Tax=Methylobacterium trifolii TaxID=1003092 RepID=A0ABQ4TT88_9HYPH|nr:hypothetical protein [Methylobacterium trifolii]GJE58104.1 hypothetical protein MPOCJGCO_0182 [Methylobacterium trifolii]
MDAAYNSALSALAGSAIGAMASFATTWLTQHSQVVATLLVQDRARREALYGEFIREASTLFGDASRHDLDDPAKLVNLHAIVNKIRLFGGRILSRKPSVSCGALARPISPRTRISPSTLTFATPAPSIRSARSRRSAAGSWRSPAGQAQ